MHSNSMSWQEMKQTQLCPPVIYDVIDVPTDFKNRNFPCKLAWQIEEDVPSIKLPKSSSSHCSDEDFHSEDEKCHENETQDDSQEVNGTPREEEKEDAKSDVFCSDDDQILCSDIIFSVPEQSPKKVLSSSHFEHDLMESGLQSMLLDNYVTEEKKTKKCLSKKRIRKSFTTKVVSCH